MSARPLPPAPPGGAHHAPPRFSIVERVRLAHEILAQYARVRWLLRRHPLPDVLAALRVPLDAPARDIVAVDPRRLAFVTVRVLRPLPADTRCLNRSLTLLALLTRRGIDATLVIGVNSSDEFGAHAWLELEGSPLLRPWPDEGRLVEL